MNTNHSIHLLSVALSFATIGLSLHAEVPNKSAALVAPSNAVIAIMITSDEPAAAAGPTAATAEVLAPVRWIDIKDCTSEMRGQFFAGLQRLEMILNQQIADLTAKRAGLPNASDTAALDAAILEIGHHRFFLIALGKTLSRATPEAWEKQKATVGLAWLKSQAVYAKINPDPTS